METVSKYSRSGYEGSSFNSKTPNGLVFSEYDVVVLCSSWDPRCLNIAKMNMKKIPYGIAFMFENKDSFGKRDKHDGLIHDWLDKNVTSYAKISGASTDVKSAFIELYRKLITLCTELGRPLKILFDLSTCPRFISLSLLSKGMNTGIVKEIDYLYGECSYPERVVGVLGGVEEVMFTSGQWDSMPIEHLLGDYSPGKQSNFTISIGFEGNKILRVLDKEDPDYINLLIPDPGFSESYVLRVMEANSELLRLYDIPEKRIIRSNAGDAVEAWRRLDLNFLNESNKVFNYTYLCAGSKPHSLGLTLSAMASEKISVLYSLPKDHNFVSVEPEEKYWLYRIKSLLVPTIISK